MLLTFLAVFSIEAGVFTVTDIAAYSSCHTHATILTWKRDKYVGGQNTNKCL